MARIEAEELEQVSIRNLKDQGYFQGDMAPLLEGISFVTSNCNLGGKRFWFLCKCGTRVGILYAINDSFWCKNCLNLTYRSRNEKKSLRNDPIFKALNMLIKARELENKVKRPVYGNKVTKKQQKLEQIYKNLTWF